MSKISGGQAVVKALEDEGVSFVFGLIGSAGMEIFDALYDSKKIQFIGVHDERTGLHMADGYARASQNVGVFLAGQNGPGTTNLATGLAQAKAAFSSVVSLAGALSSEHAFRDAFQEVDQQSLFTPITKKTMSVPSAGRIPEFIQESFRIASSPRKGPVHVNIPRNLLSQECSFDDSFRKKSSCFYGGNQPTQQNLDEAASMILQAKKPVIVVGGGIKNTCGHDEVLALAELLHAPLVCSPGHGDALPYGHPLNAGQMGPRGNMVASRLVKEADLIIALGTRLGFNATFYSYEHIHKDAAIIHVDNEPTAIGRYFPADLGIWACAKETATSLKNIIATKRSKEHAQKQCDDWTRLYHEERASYRENRDRESAHYTTPIQPQSLFHVLRHALPNDIAVTMDAGTLCLQATDALCYQQPLSLFTPLDFGLVGFSYACGLGVKCAYPDRPVLSLMGDGGFGMTLSEISTAVDYQINHVTLVMNNKCWGAEKAYQRDFFQERYIGADISSPPFDKIAELYGAKGYKCDHLDDLGDILQESFTLSKPVIIDVSVDPQALYSFRRDSFAHRKST